MSNPQYSPSRFVLLFGLGLMAIGPLSASKDKSGPLPIVGAEIISQGSDYSNSGGGPRGDRHPEIGTGHQLVDDDGTKVALDFRGNSLVIDLGQVQKVERLRIDAGERPAADSLQNLINGNLEIYYSLDNKKFLKIKRPQEKVESGDPPFLLLSGFKVEARYMKVHSRYLGDAYRVVGIVNKLVGAFGESGPQAGNRLVVDYGLLQSGTNQVKINAGTIRPSGKLQFRFQLWPYLREPTTEPLEHGKVDVSSDDSDHDWKAGSLKITRTEPGFYQLSVECVDKEDDTLLWKEEVDLHLVSRVHRLTFPGSEASPTVAAGEALVVTPGPAGEPPGGWTINRHDPLWPLWTCAANRVSTLPIPAVLSGTCATYLGVRGAGSAEVSIGKETAELKSSAGRSADRINESFFGLIPLAEASEITIRSRISPEPLEVAYLKILALTPAQAEVANGKAAAFQNKKLIFYCDGYSIHGAFSEPRNYTSEDFEKYADEFRDSKDIVERFDFCQGMSSVICSHLSKVPTTEYPGQFGHFDTNWSKFTSQNIKVNFIDQGLNPIEVMGKRLQTHGVPLYVGYRMNAWYDSPMDLHYVSAYWREHPEFRVEPYRGQTWAARSYAYPEVRKFNLEVIKEMLGLGVQGVHLEFMRHPPFVGYDAPLVEAFKNEHGKSPLDPDFDLWVEWQTAQREVLTSYIREVRALLNQEGEKHNTRFELTARIDYRNFRAQSLDLERWAKEGLVDAIIPGDYSIRNHSIDLAPFQRMVEGTKVKVYGSLSPEESGTRDPTPEDDERGVPPPEGMIPREDMKGIVVDTFRQGASGVYMFNNGGTGAYSDWRQFRSLESWDQYENPDHLSKFPYSRLLDAPK